MVQLSAGLAPTKGCCHDVVDEILCDVLAQTNCLTMGTVLHHTPLSPNGTLLLKRTNLLTCVSVPDETEMNFF